MARPTIAPLKHVDRVAHEPAMLALSKARTMAWVVAQLGAGHNNLTHALEDSSHPGDTHGRLQEVAEEALKTAHDEIEREYRKLATATPKDGA